MSKELNPKQIAFCREYVLNGNASEAYIKSGHSEKGARQSAYRLLTKAYIQDYIEELQKEGAKKYEFTRKTAHDMLQNLHDLHQLGTPNVAKGCVDSMLKMYGLNEAEKVDLTSKGDKLSSIDMGVLSEKALQEIANAPKSSD